MLNYTDITQNNPKYCTFLLGHPVYLDLWIFG